MYRGKLSDGTFIAIRSLRMKKRRSPQAYTHHLELISKIRHCHLVSALGHCLEFQLDDSGISRIFLVFEFAPNGTLRDFISGKVISLRACSLHVKKERNGTTVYMSCVSSYSLTYSRSYLKMHKNFF